ncbi:hypothetical protein [Pseudotabrizicola formosa]|uniref:hypothetical protein n=1 Tax=Pseudotabrizicola formosa TaxID=2030009 RepID=UPI0011AF3ED3|nr:hypothetical protein [Pseudotabrizicola formosa]
MWQSEEKAAPPRQRQTRMAHGVLLQCSILKQPQRQEKATATRAGFLEIYSPQSMAGLIFRRLDQDCADGPYDCAGSGNNIGCQLLLFFFKAKRMFYDRGKVTKGLLPSLKVCKERDVVE